MSRRDDALMIVVAAGTAILLLIAVVAQSAWVTVAVSLVVFGAAMALRLASGPLLIMAAILTAIGGDLLFINVSTEGSGILPLGGMIACFLPLLSSRRVGFLNVGRMLFDRAKALLLWTGLGILLPILGVLCGFPVRTVATAIAPLGILALVWLGAAVQAAGTDVGAVVRKTLIPILWVVLIVGLSQLFLYKGSGMPFMYGLVSFIAERIRESGRNVIYARASGFYANPNTLSFLGGLAAVVAFGDLQTSSVQRILILIPSLGLMAIGQSRIAILSFLISLTIHALWFKSPKQKKKRSTKAIMAVTFALLLVAPIIREWAPEVSSGLEERLTSMLSVTSRGAAMDASAEGRVGFWNIAWSQFASEPMGTLGPPQMVIQSSIDNEYIYTLVQGGIIYLAAEIWLFVWAFRSSSIGVLSFSGVAVMYVFFAGLSQSITSLAPTSIFWILLGASLWSPRNTCHGRSNA